MSTTVFTVPTDAVVTVPIHFFDQIGRPIAAPADGAVSIDNEEIATTELSADGCTLTITPYAAGLATVTVTYANGARSLTAGVDIITPVATSASFGHPTIASFGQPTYAAAAAS
jgi:hypothetical protein